MKTWLSSSTEQLPTSFQVDLSVPQGSIPLHLVIPVISLEKRGAFLLCTSYLTPPTEDYTNVSYNLNFFPKSDLYLNFKKNQTVVPRWQQALMLSTWVSGVWAPLDHCWFPRFPGTITSSSSSSGFPTRCRWVLILPAWCSPAWITGCQGPWLTLCYSLNLSPGSSP